MAESKITKTGIPQLEYVGNINTQLESSWECPANGYVYLNFSVNTSGNTAYLYISDMTFEMPVARINTPANGMYTTANFLVIKDHTYKITAVAAQEFMDAYYMKFV